MLNVGNGIYVNGRLSEEEYAEHIKYDLDKVSVLLAIGITRDCSDEEKDTLMRVSYQRVLGLIERITKRIGEDVRI